MSSINPIAWLYWDPPREIFTIPFIERPIAIYGLLFAAGFIIGYFILCKAFKQKLLPNRPSDTAQILADQITWYIVLGILIGARLGHVFFYDWPNYQNNWIDILKVWEGGLASHGGVIGLFIGLYLFKARSLKPFPEMSFIALLDCIAVPSALIGCLIRIGNFFNQEVLGPETTLPWAVIFGHPADGSFPVPRHPAQLYEAIAYMMIFFVLTALWIKRKAINQPGLLSGSALIMIFTSRFAIEFVKSPQSMIIDESTLQMGQYLSIPFILLGLYLVFNGVRWKTRRRA